MLDVALRFLQTELNSYQLTCLGSSFGNVEIGRPVDDNGKWAIKEDHIGVALINIEEERTLRSQLPETTYVNGRHLVLEPELRLNLHVLFATNFKQYDQALRQLSYVLTFFQAHPVFTVDRHPGLDPRIQKLSVELLSLTYEQLNQVWAFIGGRQLPSVIYRVRMVVLQDVAPSTVQPPITTVAAEVRGA
jgi:hypothetical protein